MDNHERQETLLEEVIYVGLTRRAWLDVILSALEGEDYSSLVDLFPELPSLVDLTGVAEGKEAVFLNYVEGLPKTRTEHSEWPPYTGEKWQE